MAGKVSQDGSYNQHVYDSGDKCMGFPAQDSKKFGMPKAAPKDDKWQGKKEQTLPKEPKVTR